MLTPNVAVTATKTHTAREGSGMAMTTGAAFPGLTTPPPPEAPPRSPPAAPVPDVPYTRVGSHYDAKQLRARIQQVLAGLERTGDQLGALLQTAQDRHIYRMLESPSGAYFTDFTAFCTAPQPWGLGMSEALIQALVKEQRDPQRRARLVLEGPQVLQTRNAPRTGRGAGPAAARGTAYSLARLRRDRPDLLRSVAEGRLTIQQAAEQAGHRPPFTGVLIEPQSIARLIVSRLDEPQQREVIDLVQHPEKIVDPGHGKNVHWDGYLSRTLGPEAVARRRAEATAAKAAHREAYQTAYNGRRQAAREARRAQAQAVGLPSLAMTEAAG